MSPLDLTVDLSGTQIRSALFTAEGQILRRVAHPTLAHSLLGNDANPGWAG